MTQKQAYKALFKNYPDVLDIAKMCELLDIGYKSACKLLKENEIEYLRIGRFSALHYRPQHTYCILIQNNARISG